MTVGKKIDARPPDEGGHFGEDFGPSVRNEGGVIDIGDERRELMRFVDHGTYDLERLDAERAAELRRALPT